MLTVIFVKSGLGEGGAFRHGQALVPAPTYSH